jgi:hypothetical protein
MVNKKAQSVKSRSRQKPVKTEPAESSQQVEEKNIERPTVEVIAQKPSDDDLHFWSEIRLPQFRR